MRTARLRVLTKPCSTVRQMRSRSHALGAAPGAGASSIPAPSLRAPTEFADDLKELRTCDPVWKSPTLKKAWRVLHDQMKNTETSQNWELEKDRRALALCSARAELAVLLAYLPATLRSHVDAAPRVVLDAVEEFFIHVGMDAEVRGRGWAVTLPAPSLEDVRFIVRRVEIVSNDNRGCIPGTLHRVSAWRDKSGERVLGVTIRVGRYVPGSAAALTHLAERGNILLLSPPGLGKTTLLRDLAISLAHSQQQPRVIVVDNSNEIAGDSIVPLPYFGRVRRMQVGTRSAQQQAMSEVLGNHTPDVVIVDELASVEECNNAWSMSQRGIRLIATAHSETLEKLLNNRELNILVGGATQAFLSNEERRLRNKQRKTILERPYPSPFDSVVQLLDRESALIYEKVDVAVDAILDGQNVARNASLCKTIKLAQKPGPKASPPGAQPLASDAQRRLDNKGGRGGPHGNFDDDDDDDDDDDGYYDDGVAQSTSNDRL